ncbi:MAG: riboflavin synthase [Betaproteobacteria bacterium]|jgi:riboflavin synthase|nr:riboflavin synthase [Betaproteobacteria bacterium]MCH9849300.1 riboflavin synthase [Betaproteobacteria bacterium]MDG1097103.1 riboflavin synthase [Methylophilaceae bacterium]MDG1452858.1 riboflavin synthase [Methylophilaceae bacterium]
MFTGIIQAVGQLTPATQSTGDIQISIAANQLDLSDVNIGDSIAVNGVCLTVTTINQTHFTADVSKETLTVTTGLNQKGFVNLEKAMRLDSRLGGHLVSGHVDGIGEVVQFEAINDCWLLVIRAPHAISKYIARKGSICVNGVSLTTNSIEKDNFAINIIPHTLEKTTLGALNVGSKVNLEIDQIARYVERMQQWETESN